MLTRILGEGLAQVGFGVALGVMLCILGSRLVSGLLFGVTAVSVTPYLVVAGVLMVFSAAACYVPARRAMRVDPTQALRSD